ncbi:predicted protein [Sclerotinia sclerotiorum 1980 UF-70]|uniref:Uncharacterized protein n=1 Tax=Sclerotinia sclerotiorum (strain ATCC 18683 / 1980 / Ss-1) TaxID=665079 RepID=A7E4I1_SCLS1|nr:predicted protein [Sclerotinia sclerotiorum 1980 UF-70]EDN90803.1 predicted protein [Sclerotinia sclerotiorum 1980 UF-70]
MLTKLRSRTLQNSLLVAEPGLLRALSNQNIPGELGKQPIMNNSSSPLSWVISSIQLTSSDIVQPNKDDNRELFVALKGCFVNFSIALNNFSICTPEDEKASLVVAQSTDDITPLIRIIREHPAIALQLVKKGLLTAS